MNRKNHFILIDHIPVALDCSTVKRFIRWMLWMENNRSQRIIAQDRISSYWVSTVFVGEDHHFSSNPPMLFETMIFETDESACLLIDNQVEWIDCPKSELHHLRWRYPTWEEAEHGHSKVIGMVKRYVDKGSAWRRFITQMVKTKPMSPYQRS